MIDIYGLMAIRLSTGESPIRYRGVELALAHMHAVTPEEIGAFRAKIRHLRNIGVPRLPSPGSGIAIDYTERQVLEMLIALELESLGHAPKSAADLAASIVRQAPYGQHEGRDCYVMLDKSTAGYRIFYGLGHLGEELAKAAEIFAIINVSGCVRKLNEAFEKTNPSD